MSFPAKYPGECNGCGAKFEEGAEIEYGAGGDILLSVCCGETEEDQLYYPEEWYQ